MDIINELLDSIGEKANSIHVAKMGVVDKFNPDTMTADIMPLPAGDYSLVKNVVVTTLRGGDMIAYYPLKKGDKVLLVFADNDTDNLKQGGDNSNTERQHDISDAFCVGGLEAINKPVTIADPDAFVIQNSTGDTYISIKDGEVKIESPSVKVESPDIELVGKAIYRGREIAVKGDGTSDGANIV